MDTDSWDAMYRSRERVFRSEPNPVLVAEGAALAPGRALDVGCGEGADALWLARRGWQVTGVDVSGTALRRAAGAAEAAGLTAGVTWTVADLSATPPPGGPYDLVSVQYFPLRRQPDHAQLRALLGAVAPGGTFLFGTHDRADLSPDPERGFDPDDFLQPVDVVPLLGDEWTVVTEQVRPRLTPAPAGTRHTRDAVLRARRTS